MRTEMCLSLLESELVRNCGDMYDACMKAGVSTLFVNRWRADDVDVNNRLAEAERVGFMRLESEAVRRAVVGIDEPVFYKGVNVDSKKVYSDGLLQTLLKARVPAFAADGEGGRGVNVQVNIGMPRAKDYTEWLQMREQTMAQREREALPGPVIDLHAEIVGAEYTPVEQNPFEGLGI